MNIEPTVSVDLVSCRNVCSTCKGSGEYFFKGFTSLEGKVYQDCVHSCSSCEGKGTFPDLTESDRLELLGRIHTTQGARKGLLKKSFTSPYRNKCRSIEHYMQECRAYYVWRMARFHGGADVTMPMTADMLLRGDPLKAQLDIVADTVAVKTFGSNMIGAGRWRRALYG